MATSVFTIPRWNPENIDTDLVFQVAARIRAYVLSVVQTITCFPENYVVNVYVHFISADKLALSPIYAHTDGNIIVLEQSAGLTLYVDENCPDWTEMRAILAHEIGHAVYSFTEKGCVPRAENKDVIAMGKHLPFIIPLNAPDVRAMLKEHGIDVAYLWLNVSERFAVQYAAKQGNAAERDRWERYIDAKPYLQHVYSPNSDKAERLVYIGDGLDIDDYDERGY